MVVIGVTGGVGTGKSTIAAMFHELGAVVLDADAIVHQLMEPRRLVWRRMLKAFGERILNDDHTIHRQRLASIVFADAQARRRLEAIVHPQVLRRMQHDLSRLRRRLVKAAVLDVPLLMETGAEGLADVVVVVTAPPAVQRERLAKQQGWSAGEVSRRMAAQWEMSAKVALADYVVDNADGRAATRRQVKQIWTQINNSSRATTNSR